MAYQVFTRDRAALKQRGSSTMLWGLALVIFGIAVLVWPELTGGVLIALIGVTIFLIGLSLMYGAYRLREVAERAWVLAMAPAASVALFGAFVMLFPGAVGAIIIMIVAILMVIAGIGDIGSSFLLVPVFSWWWLQLLRGLLMAGAGVWILLSGLSGLVAIGTLIGIWALLMGALTISFGALAATR